MPICQMFLLRFGELRLAKMLMIQGILYLNRFPAACTPLRGLSFSAVQEAGSAVIRIDSERKNRTFYDDGQIAAMPFLATSVWGGRSGIWLGESMRNVEPADIALAVLRIILISALLIAFVS